MPALIVLVKIGLYLAMLVTVIAAIAVVQILLYVGAVMTLVIFAVMLTERMGDKTVASKNQLGLPALAGAVIFFAALCRLIAKTPWPIREIPNPPTTTLDLGKAFMGTYVFPFEVISIILIVALIGAVIIARREKS